MKVKAILTVIAEADISQEDFLDEDTNKPMTPDQIKDQLEDEFANDLDEVVKNYDTQVTSVTITVTE